MQGKKKDVIYEFLMLFARVILSNLHFFALVSIALSMLPGSQKREREREIHVK